MRDDFTARTKESLAQRAMYLCSRPESPPVAIATDAEGQPSFGERRVKFDLRALNITSNGDESYDVAPSGDRLIFIERGSARAHEVRVVLDWLEEPDRAVPVR